jgi:hypothetical protein
MTNKYVGAAKFFANLITGGGAGKQKTTGTEVIKNFGIAKNIDTKRAIQDNVVSAVDSAFKKADVPPSLRNQQKKSKLKKDESKKLKDVSYKLDKLEEKVKAKKFNKGGRVGKKFGGGMDMTKRKTNIQKIKEAFGPKSKKNLKPVDKKKNPGLAKLPIEVRNKMGYAKKGGRA